MICKFFKKLFKKKSKKETDLLKEWDAFEIRILRLVNDYRVENNKPRFIVNNKLKNYTKIRAIKYLNGEIIIEENGSHTGWNGEGGMAQTLIKLGFEFPSENLGRGYHTAKGLVDAWKGSIKHKRVLLGNDTYVGITRVVKDNKRAYCLITAK